MKIALIGHGKMGKSLEKLIIESTEFELCGIFNSSNICELKTFNKSADAIIDFSGPDALEIVLNYAIRSHTPYVCGTTGFEVLPDFSEAASVIPILYDSNFSLGIALFRKILHVISSDISGFDIELSEIHHKTKLDAPSGTAKSLLQILNKNNQYKLVYGREGVSPRGKNEIGVHSLRAGSVSSEHYLSLFGEDEVLEISHRAASEDVFSKGALYATKKLVSMKAGIFSLQEVIYGSD